jgi:ketosteroid isomerase-like protein
VDTIVAQFEDDSWLLAPDAPIASGKEAIKGIFEQIMSMPGMDLAWTPSTAVVSNDASMGFTIGSYKMKLDGPDGNPVEINGKYKTVWRKQADGSWKVITDMFNADAPMASPE